MEDFLPQLKEMSGKFCSCIYESINVNLNVVLSEPEIDAASVTHFTAEADNVAISFTLQQVLGVDGGDIYLSTEGWRACTT